MRCLRCKPLVIANDGPEPVTWGGAAFGPCGRCEACGGPLVELALQLVAVKRRCNVCHYETEGRGAGPDGVLCPLLACPGELQ